MNLRNLTPKSSTLANTSISPEMLAALARIPTKNPNTKIFKELNIEQNIEKNTNHTIEYAEDLQPWNQQEWETELQEMSSGGISKYSSEGAEVEHDINLGSLVEMLIDEDSDDVPHEEPHTAESPDHESASPEGNPPKIDPTIYQFIAPKEFSEYRDEQATRTEQRPRKGNLAEDKLNQNHDMPQQEILSASPPTNQPERANPKIWQVEDTLNTKVDGQEGESKDGNNHNQSNEPQNPSSPESPTGRGEREGSEGDQPPSPEIPRPKKISTSTRWIAFNIVLIILILLGLQFWNDSRKVRQLEEMIDLYQHGYPSEAVRKNNQKYQYYNQNNSTQESEEVVYIWGLSQFSHFGELVKKHHFKNNNTQIKPLNLPIRKRNTNFKSNTLNNIIATHIAHSSNTKSTNAATINTTKSRTKEGKATNATRMTPDTKKNSQEHQLSPEKSNRSTNAIPEPDNQVEIVRNNHTFFPRGMQTLLFLKHKALSKWNEIIEKYIKNKGTKAQKNPTRETTRAHPGADTKSQTNTSGNSSKHRFMLGKGRVSAPKPLVTTPSISRSGHSVFTKGGRAANPKVSKHIIKLTKRHIMTYPPMSKHPNKQWSRDSSLIKISFQECFKILKNHKKMLTSKLSGKEARSTFYVRYSPDGTLQQEEYIWGSFLGDPEDRSNFKDLVSSIIRRACSRLKYFESVDQPTWGSGKSTASWNREYSGISLTEGRDVGGKRLKSEHCIAITQPGYGARDYSLSGIPLDTLRGDNGGFFVSIAFDGSWFNWRQFQSSPCIALEGIPL